jgi:hypothetical protein
MISLTLGGWPERIVLSAMRQKLIGVKSRGACETRFRDHFAISYEDNHVQQFKHSKVGFRRRCMEPGVLPNVV